MAFRMPEPVGPRGSGGNGPAGSRGGGSDASVQGTNDDAQVSKLSCVRTGYWQDPYLQHFVRKPSRRSPMINRGYYSRHAAMETLLQRFLAAGGPDTPKQVLALGAGFDTAWFRLQAAGSAPAKYIEVDFADVTRRKAAIVATKSELRSLLNASAGGDEGQVTVDAAAGRIVTPRYCLLPTDLRDLAGFEAALREVGFDPSLPTYVLSECVFVYIDPPPVAALVAFLGSLLPTAAVVVYEQINPDDAFGRQMVSNLESRGCPLKGLKGTPTLAAHRERFLSSGWAYAESNSLDGIYRRYLDPADKARIERLEVFDEFEEWALMQGHYAVTVARNDAAGILAGVGFGASEDLSA